MLDQKFQVKLRLALGESTCKYLNNVVLTGWIKWTVRNCGYVFRCCLHRVVSHTFERFLVALAIRAPKKLRTGTTTMMIVRLQTLFTQRDTKLTVFWDLCCLCSRDSNYSRSRRRSGRRKFSYGCVSPCGKFRLVLFTKWLRGLRGY